MKPYSNSDESRSLTEPPRPLETHSITRRVLAVGWVLFLCAVAGFFGLVASSFFGALVGY